MLEQLKRAVGSGSHACYPRSDSAGMRGHDGSFLQSSYAEVIGRKVSLPDSGIEAFAAYTLAVRATVFAARLTAATASSTPWI